MLILYINLKRNKLAHPVKIHIYQKTTANQLLVFLPNIIMKEIAWLANQHVSNVLTIILVPSA